VFTNKYNTEHPFRLIQCWNTVQRKRRGPSGLPKSCTR